MDTSRKPSPQGWAFCFTASFQALRKPISRRLRQ
jgi:hypothetical protein